MIVDTHGVIHLDSSSSDDSDGAAGVARTTSTTTTTSNVRNHAPPTQTARKSAPAPSPAKRSAPVAAHKAALSTGYDSDEHLQYVIREILSSDDAISDDDTNDSDASFDGAASRHRHRHRQTAKRKRKRVSSSKRRTHATAARPVAKKRKHERTSAKRTRSSDSDSDSLGLSSSSSSESDAHSRKLHTRPPSSSKSKIKAKSKLPAQPLRTSRPINVLVVSSDASSSSSSDDNEDRRAAAAQRTPPHKQKQKYQQPQVRPRPVAKPARLPVPTPPAPPRPSTPAASASAGTSSHRRSDFGYHALTEKLSFSELQAQRRALEQLAAQHRRGTGGVFAAAVAASAAASGRKAPARTESRKSAGRNSRVDTIERRGRVRAAAPTIVIAPSARRTPTPPLSTVQTPVLAATDLTIPTSMPPSSISAAGSISFMRSSSTVLPPLHADDPCSTAPAVHSTAWRRLRLVRTPPNLLCLDAAHLLPFSDEYDRPLPDFDATGTLAHKTQVLATFEQTASADAGSSDEDDMTERVQQLIAEAQPLLRACQERRVQSILRGTRVQLASYLSEHARMRAQLMRCAIPHSTFDLSTSERNDAQRLYERRRRLAPRLNALVGRVRYVVATRCDADANADDDDSASADAATATSTTPSSDATTNAATKETDSDGSADTAPVECVLDERTVFPETVIELSDDTPALRRSWAYVGVKKNVHVADDPVLRYIPYLGENTRVHIDPNRYASTTMDASKRVELVGSRTGSVLELKAVVASALDDDASEYLLRYVVRACGAASRRVFAALQATGRFAQPSSDYCEIQKHDLASKRVVERIAGMQQLLQRDDRTARTDDVCTYLQTLGASCWFLQPRKARASLAHRLKPPIPYFASNYQRSATARGLRDTTVYSEATEWFRDLFCRRCYTYDCDDHGILQPTPSQRADPVYPVVTRAGLAKRTERAATLATRATSTSTAAQAVEDADADVISIDADRDVVVTSQPPVAAAPADDANVIALDASSSDDDDDVDIVDGHDGHDNQNDGSGDDGASDGDDSAAAVRRRSRRSQTRISTLASASLKVQEKMQARERRRQRRVGAKQLQLVTRTDGDSEYLDDSHAATIAAAVQALVAADAPCSAACYKTQQGARADTVADVASRATTAAARTTDGSAAPMIEAAASTSEAATPASPRLLDSIPATTASSTPTFTDVETLLLRKLAATLGDSACLIAAMLHSDSCSCAQVAQFLAHERELRLASTGSSALDVVSSDRRRSLSTDLSTRRQQRSDRRSGNTTTSLLNPSRDGLKRTRAQRTPDTKAAKRSYQPCSHDGACDGCECMKRGHHCDKACACDRTCPNRFAGCRCSVGTCRTKACACYAIGRECDPDFCFTCGASDAAVLGLGLGVGLNKRLNYDVGLCCNANLVRGAMRKVGISFSTTHGWGAFALEPIRKGEFLYEYTGALISDDEAERRGNLYDVMAISFLFDVNCDDVVDATRKGNKSKFANHKALDAANCEAKILLVNGEHRIALYAREAISVGEELFFDYGYTHETAPKWSRVETRRNGHRVEVAATARAARKANAVAFADTDLLDDLDDVDDDDDDLD